MQSTAKDLLAAQGILVRFLVGFVQEELQLKRQELEDKTVRVKQFNDDIKHEILTNLEDFIARCEHYDAKNEENMRKSDCPICFLP